MNNKKVNGAKHKKEVLRPTEKNDFDSNSTESFDMNDFKTSSLTEKYSVHVHKNEANLMAELDCIMADESDVEIVERGATNGKADKSGQNYVSFSSKDTSLNLSDDRPNGDFDSDKKERVLSWAQSQSQNLSMSIASILSDHDYLSQERLVGLVTDNEGNAEAEIPSRCPSNGDINPPLNGIDDSGATRIQNETNRNTAAPSSNEIPFSKSIDTFAISLQRLTDTSDHAERIDLQKQIEQNLRALFEQAKPSAHSTTVEKVPQDTAQSSQPDFSPGRSEPMEYYHTGKFSTQTSVEDTDNETQGNLSRFIVQCTLCLPVFLAVIFCFIFLLEDCTINWPYSLCFQAWSRWLTSKMSWKSSTKWPIG